MKINLFIFLFFVFEVTTMAQSKLENYIKIGFENNEGIKQQNFNVNKSYWALKESKSLFYPRISFNANYTLAEGGRTVDFPIGDLLNPVYSSLNQLIGSNAFPNLDNQSILLNPNNFYDVKLHTTMPLLNWEIIYNKSIKTSQNNLQKIELELFKRELVKDIKIAYYKYGQSKKAIEIYETALKLAQENSRVNQSLFKNDKINRTAVLRSENEVKRIEAKLNEAKNNCINAKAFFNFLINKKLDDEIELDDLNATFQIEFQNENVIQREELVKLNTVLDINNTVTKLTQSYWLPKISAFVDLGYQDFDFQINQQSRYFFGGIALEWNVFSGNKNKFRLKQNLEEANYVNSQIKNVTEQLILQLKIAKNNLLSKIEIYNAEKSQNIASKKFNDDIFKLYKEGQAIYIELLDAQNQYINSLLLTNIALYDVWIANAELERANASFNINF